MRIEIKTKTPVKDKDIKAMYVIAYAFSLLEKRMIKPTLEYFADYFGYRIEEKC